MTVYLYARVSADEIAMECSACSHKWRLRQASPVAKCPECGTGNAVLPNKTTIASQHSIMKGFAQLKFPDGTQDIVSLWEIVSASTSWRERKVMGELMDRIQPGDSIVVLRIDRGWRSTRDFLDSIEWARRAKCGLLVAELAMDFVNDPLGKCVGTILATFAELERELTSKRRKDAAAHKRERGIKQLPTTAPLGHRLVVNSSGNYEVVPHPEEMELLRTLLDLKRQMTEAQLLAYVNQKGIRNRLGNPFRFETLRKYVKAARALNKQRKLPQAVKV